jgi:hypothetical protein
MIRGGEAAMTGFAEDSKHNLGATGIEPMTSTVSSTVKRKLDKGFSRLSYAGFRKTTQRNCNSAPWAHPENFALGSEPVSFPT